MTLQFTVLAGLMAFAAVCFVLVISRLWQRDAAGESNLDWLRIREEELAGEDDSLRTDAELRVLQELSESAGDDVSTPAGSRVDKPVLLVLLLALLVAPGLMYWQVGSLEDVRITQAIAELDQAQPEQARALMAEIEARSLSRPENADYLSLLGQFYTGTERHEDALEAFNRLLELYPESPEILARAAQAEYLALNRDLVPRARRRAEAALATDPNQRTALGTLGIAAFEAGNYRAAVDYWERLLAFEAPGSPGYQMMTGVLAEARSRGGLSELVPAVSDVGVTVSVALPPNAAIPADATVFVLARPAGAVQRMPTAVQRRAAGELPFDLRLDDSAAMAGQKISVLPAVDIEVQVSPSGNPGRSNATWLGTADNVIPSPDSAVSLVLRPATT